MRGPPIPETLALRLGDFKDSKNFLEGWKRRGVQVSVININSEEVAEEGREFAVPVVVN